MHAIAASDYDGDGLTDLQEYLAGTHPLDATTLLNAPWSWSNAAGI